MQKKFLSNAKTEEDLFNEDKLFGETEKAVPVSTFVEELIGEWRRNEEFRQKHRVLAFFKDIWWWLKYGLRNKIRDFKYSVKWFIQRGKRGFSDDDFFNGDWFLADLISRFLKHVAKHGTTYPGFMTPEEWEARLLKIAKAFDDYRNFDQIEYVMEKLKKTGLKEGTEEYQQEYRRLVKESDKAARDICNRMKELFEPDVFFHLWD